MSTRSARNTSWLKASIRLASMALFLLSCSSEPTPAGSSGAPAASGKPDVTKLFARSITNVAIEIDYADGAAPAEGELKNFGPVWSLFNANVLAVFDGKKTVSFPTKVSAMEKLGDVPAKSFSNQDLLDVAAAHRNEASTADTASFYVVFVNGYWIDDSGAEQQDIISVSVGGTGVIGVFKPAIESPLIEQLALIHAFGHAVGFVDNGVPVGEANKGHVDESGKHCTNEKCAMHAAVETAAGAKKYASTLIRSPEAVLIGQDCLSDARLLESTQLSQ
ncbi:MAG: hypothetical protein KF819_22260 [Labilithrix sp.]|nr:hypothetical protein [Labilithrix sp.]